MDFSKFDDAINVAQMKKDIAEAEKNGGNFAKVPNGNYVGKFEKLEVGATKDKRPMLTAQFKIKEGESKGRMLFFNRVLYGTKNDSNMIAGAVGFLRSLEPSEDLGPIEFNGYADFAELVLDIAEDIESLEYEIEYDEDAFNSISIVDVFEA